VAGRARAGAQIGGAPNSVRLCAFANGPRRNFAVAYGAGVVLYFTAEREPPMWAVAVPTAVFALCALLLRRRIVSHVIALGLFGIALGFAVATLKTALIGHPVLRFPASGFRSFAARRLQPALSLKSKFRSSHRCSRSNLAATISRAICFSRASVHPVLSAAR
jgi:hypothetical protein